MPTDRPAHWGASPAARPSWHWVGHRRAASALALLGLRPPAFTVLLPCPAAAAKEGRDNTRLLQRALGAANPAPGAGTAAAHAQPPRPTAQVHSGEDARGPENSGRWGLPGAAAGSQVTRTAELLGPGWGQGGVPPAGEPAPAYPAPPAAETVQRHAQPGQQALGGTGSPPQQGAANFMHRNCERLGGQGVASLLSGEARRWKCAGAVLLLPGPASKPCCCADGCEPSCAPGHPACCTNPRRGTGVAAWGRRQGGRGVHGCPGRPQAGADGRPEAQGSSAAGAAQEGPRAAGG